MRSTPTTSRSSARSTGGASSHSGRAPKASWNPSEASRSRTVMRTAGDTGGLGGRSMPAACHNRPARNEGPRGGARLSGPLTRASSPEPGVDPARVPVRIATAVGPGCATLDAGGVDSSMYRLGVALLLAAGLVLAGCGPGPAGRARARADLGAPDPDPAADPALGHHPGVVPAPAAARRRRLPPVRGQRRAVPPHRPAGGLGPRPSAPMGPGRPLRRQLRPGEELPLRAHRPRPLGAQRPRDPRPAARDHLSRAQTAVFGGGDAGAEWIRFASRGRRPYWRAWRVGLRARRSSAGWPALPGLDDGRLRSGLDAGGVGL